MTDSMDQTPVKFDRALGDPEFQNLKISIPTVESEDSETESSAFHEGIEASSFINLRFPDRDRR